MTELNKQEKDVLNGIVNDKFAVGAFTGMIFNSLVERDIPPTVENIKAAIAMAIKIRIVAAKFATEE